MTISVIKTAINMGPVIAFFVAVNHNYDHKQQTLKHRNTQNGSKSTNHKSETMTFLKFCFLRGCLHDTGATFAPRRVHSGSLSWLYICLHDTTTKSHAGASRPGVSSLQLSHRGENFTPVRNLATVSCKHETTTRFGVKSV